MSKELEIRSRLERKGIYPSEHLGQHILIDEGVLNLVANQVDSSSNVLEIGSGPGNLTEKIARRANKVVGIEIDCKFQSFLDGVQAECPNVEIIYKDAMMVNFEKIIKDDFLRRTWQIASNLPFHISEPFLTKIADLPIEGASLIVGDQLARRMQIDQANNPEFSKTSLITQTFFEPSILAWIGRESFYPQPRTDAALVSLHPRDKRELQSNPRMAILRNLFLSERKNPTVEKVIKESTGLGERRPTLSKTENRRMGRRKSRQEIRQFARNWQSSTGLGHGKNNFVQGLEVDKLNLTKNILSKPFSRLDNQDLRVLVSALKKRYG